MAEYHPDHEEIQVKVKNATIGTKSHRQAHAMHIHRKEETSSFIYTHTLRTKQ